MAISTLNAVLPENSEQFPKSSEVMPPSLRIEAFRPVSTNLLQALANISNIGEPPKSWVDLEREAPPFDNMKTLSIVNPEQRVHIGATITEPGGMKREGVVVNGLVRVFRGDDDIRVIEKYGNKVVDYKGIPSALVEVRGVLGGDGNPNFKRGHDCEPELQHLSIGLEFHDEEMVDVVKDEVAEQEFLFAIPCSVDYAFFDKPPVGDEDIVKVTQLTTDFLQEIA